MAKYGPMRQRASPEASLLMADDLAILRRTFAAAPDARHLLIARGGRQASIGLDRSSTDVTIDSRTWASMAQESQ